MHEGTMLKRPAVRIRLNRTVHYIKYCGVRILNVILEILTAVTKKYTVFLDVKLCSLVEIYRNFWRKSFLPSSGQIEQQNIWKIR